MISSYDDLKKSYGALKSKKRWRNFAREGIVMIAMFGIVPIGVIVAATEPFDPVLLVGGIIGLFVFVIIIRKMIQIRKLPPLKNHQLIFLPFFEAYKGLHELKESYRAKQEELYDNNKKNAIEAIESFVYDIELWISSYAPTGLVNTQSEIKKILEENIIPMIQNDDKQTFSSFANYILETCDSLHKHDFTYDEWVVFKTNLKKFGLEKSEKDTVKSKKKIISKRSVYWRRKEVIGPVTWVLSTAGAYLYSQEFLLSIGIGASMAAAIAYFFSKQYRKTDTHDKFENT